MRNNIVIGGFGGQGIMIAGGILCQAAAIEGKFSTFFPSYGAEVRGGAAKCQVIISDEYIGSPIIKEIDIFLCFTKAAFNKYYLQLKERGIIIMNSDLVADDENKLDKNIKKIGIEANQIAYKVGNKLFANMVMLGAFIKSTKIFKKENVINAIKEAFSQKKNVLDLNIEAFNIGCER
ncbi:MAG: 2-oxoacid:acceptor oxidoreductase family protein [Elusimicrobiota bacterium]|jgi:2-oxoacid:acceptor oxidoreductase gamma subunit (pyruvate/2-ketoisovalerate family)|nr:2-oxoacid:acceptor oxidoreductase family protein [Elusimicrobiota bacterium]